MTNPQIRFHHGEFGLVDKNKGNDISFISLPQQYIT